MNSKLFSVLVVCLMLFSTLGAVSAVSVGSDSGVGCSKVDTTFYKYVPSDCCCNVSTYVVDGTEYFMAVLKDVDGNALVSKNVHFECGGAMYDTVTDSHGIAKFPTSNLGKFNSYVKFNIKYSFCGDDIYNPVNGSYDIYTMGGC